VVEIGRSKAIDSLKGSMTLRQIGIKLKPRRNFGFVWMDCFHNEGVSFDSFVEHI